MADGPGCAPLIAQFEQPFVVDGSATVAAFGLRPTPYRDGVAAAVDAHRTDRSTP